MAHYVKAALLTLCLLAAIFFAHLIAFSIDSNVHYGVGSSAVTLLFTIWVYEVALRITKGEKNEYHDED